MEQKSTDINGATENEHTHMNELAEDDVKNRQQNNDDLHKREDLYLKMVDGVQDYAIILLNKSGEIRNWNAGAQAIKGYTASEVIGKNFHIFYTPEDRAAGLPERLLQEAAKNGKAFHEGWRKRKDGSNFWGIISITALHSNDGSVIGFSKVTRDLTERKKADDKVKDSLAELEIKNQELEQFAYMASHDLQEPLRKVRMFSDLLRKNIHDEAVVINCLDKIVSSAERMGNIIQAVLHYSSLTPENLEWKFIDMKQVIKEVVTDFESLIEEKNAVIHVDLLPDIYCVPMLIHQLFTNLLGNALKFTRIKPVIHISSRVVSQEQVNNFPATAAEKHFIEISVADNGSL